MNRIVCILALILCLSMLFTGCQKPHEHCFSDEWTTSETEHWHIAACEHTELETDRAAHVFTPWETVTPATCGADGLQRRACEVCGYEETGVLPKASSVSSSWKLETPFVAVFGAAEIGYTRNNDVDYLILPTKEALKQVSVRSAYDGVLTTVAKDYVLLAGQTVTVDLSNGQAVRFDCVVNGVGYQKSVRIKASENLKSLALSIDRHPDTITKEDDTAATGFLTVITSDGSVTDIGSFTNFLKRGNMSYKQPDGKYSFKFKLEKKAALVQNPDGKDVKSKNWFLLANNAKAQDVTGFANAVGFENYYFLEGDGALSYEFVNLYINGSYQGVYQLVEKNTTEAKNSLAVLDEEQTNSQDPSIPLSDSNLVLASSAENGGGATYTYCANAVSSANTGFVMELERHVYDDSGIYVLTSRGKCFKVKEPDYPTKEQMQKLAAWMQGFEDALFAENGINSYGKTIGDYVDIESLAKQYLAYSIHADGDFWMQSTYLSIDCNADGSFKKLKAGNVWDMNNMHTSNGVSDLTPKVNEIYKPQFMKNGEFLAAMFAMIPQFNEHLQTEYDCMAALYESMKPAMKLNQMLWGVDFDSKGQTFLNDFKSRIKKWKTAWSDATNAMRGVTVTKNGGSLKANVTGATKYQWYRVGEDGHTGVAISGATSASYTPDRSGSYYVVVSGKALSGTACSSTLYSGVVRF